MTLNWEEYPEEAFTSNIQCFECYYNEYQINFVKYRYFLPITVIEKFYTISKFLYEIDKAFKYTPHKLRAVNKECLDFIINYFYLLEKRIVDKDHIILGSQYKTPVSFMEFYSKKGLTKNSFYKFGDILQKYAQQVYLSKCSAVSLYFSPSSQARPKLDEIAHRYKVGASFILATIICLAYDICVNCGPDCYDAIEFFINDKGAVHDSYDTLFLKNNWEQACDNVFLNKEIVTERKKLNNILEGIASFTKIELAPKVKKPKVANITVSKLPIDRLEEDSMVLLVKDIKHDEKCDSCSDDVIFCGCGAD